MLSTYHLPPIRYVWRRIDHEGASFVRMTVDIFPKLSVVVLIILASIITLVSFGDLDSAARAERDAR